MTHNQNIQNLRTAVKGEEVRTSMIELFEEDYGLVGKAIQTGTAVTGESSTDPTTGYYDGNLYINTSTLQIFKFDGTYWNEIAIIRNIENIEGTNPTADGAINTITVYYNDDTTDTFQIKNGSTGTAGVSVTGVHDNGDGTFYLTLSDGTTTGNIATVKGDTGATGPAGPTGATGAKGRDINSITSSKNGKVTSFTANYSDGTTQLIGNVTDGADGTGGGDMYQATYDTNSNGIVDLAEGLSDGTNTMPYSTVANKADKSTTLGGYGITDAYTKAEVDAAIAAGTSGAGYIQSVSNDFSVANAKLSMATSVVNKLDMLNDLAYGTNLNDVINAKANKAIIAGDWTSGSYAPGTILMDNGLLWINNTSGNLTTRPSSSSSGWTLVTLASKVMESNTAVKAMSSVFKSISIPNGKALKIVKTNSNMGYRMKLDLIGNAAAKIGSYMIYSANSGAAVNVIKIYEPSSPNFVITTSTNTLRIAPAGTGDTFVLISELQSGLSGYSFSLVSNSSNSIDEV